jgi:TolB-like protein
VRVYRLPLAETARTKTPLPLPDKPSLAVLPFQNLAGDAEQEYFVDGIVQEITTSISRLLWLFVIARNSSFTCKGRAVDMKRWRANWACATCSKAACVGPAAGYASPGQLIDTTTGAHIWADRFDGALGDIFELQDQVAGTVVRAIEPELRQPEFERAIRKPTESLDANDLYLPALAEFHKLTDEGMREAIPCRSACWRLTLSYAAAAATILWTSTRARRTRRWPPGQREPRQQLPLGRRRKAWPPSDCRLTL